MDCGVLHIYTMYAQAVQKAWDSNCWALVEISLLSVSQGHLSWWKWNNFKTNWCLLSYSPQILRLAILIPMGCEQLFSAFLLGWGSSSACADTVTPNEPFPIWSMLANIPPPSSWWHLQPFTALTKVLMTGPVSPWRNAAFLGPVNSLSLGPASYYQESSDWILEWIL